MMFKNSFKLLMANFGAVWKSLLYFIIVAGIIVGITSPVYGGLVNHFNASGDLTNLFKTAISINVSADFFGMLSGLFETLSSIASNFITLFQTNLSLAIYLTFLIFYIIPFLFNLATLPLEETLFGFMSSLTRYSFTHAFIRKMGKSVLLQLFRSLIVLPFNFLILFVDLKLLGLVYIPNMVYFLPFITLIATCVMLAIKETILSGWIPAVVVYNYGVFKGLKIGLKAVFRRFFKAFSTVLVIYFIFFVLTYILTPCSLFITAPLLFALVSIFEMVMFYGSQGMKYYVDLDTIVSPKRLAENDNFKKVKNLI